jgi:uncharacterized membrane protein YphA (DoxX/SURF4 family)
MSDEQPARALRPALLVLRSTLGVFLLQWGTEKFVVPQSTAGIWDDFYGIPVSRAAGYAFGLAEIAIALGILLGAFRTIADGSAMVLHAVSVLVSWRQMIHPWAAPANHLFIFRRAVWRASAPPPVRNACGCE